MTYAQNIYEKLYPASTTKILTAYIALKYGNLEDYVTVGEKAVIPDGVTIGKNVCISGETSLEDYPDGTLPSGGAIVEKDGE